MGFGKTIFTIGAIAGAAYGGYVLYKKFVKKEDAPQGEFDELADVTFDYDQDEAEDESFADKIKAAADRQLDKLN